MGLQIQEYSLSNYIEILFLIVRCLHLYWNIIRIQLLLHNISYLKSASQENPTSERTDLKWISFCDEERAEVFKAFQICISNEKHRDLWTNNHVQLHHSQERIIILACHWIGILNLNYYNVNYRIPTELWIWMLLKLHNRTAWEVARSLDGCRLGLKGGLPRKDFPIINRYNEARS